MILSYRQLRDRLNELSDEQLNAPVTLAWNQGELIEFYGVTDTILASELEDQEELEEAHTCFDDIENQPLIRTEYCS